MGVYKVAIRPAVLYVNETLCVTNKDADKLKIFERKINRKIYGQKKKYI